MMDPLEHFKNQEHFLNTKMKNLSSIFIDHEPLEKIPAILFHDPSWCNLIEHQENQELESIQENQETLSWFLEPRI